MNVDIDYQVDNPASEDDQLHAVLTATLSPDDLYTAENVIDDALSRRFWREGVRRKPAENEIAETPTRKFSETLRIWADVFQAVENAQPVKPTTTEQLDALTGRLDTSELALTNTNHNG